MLDKAYSMLDKAYFHRTRHNAEGPDVHKMVSTTAKLVDEEQHAIRSEACRTSIAHPLPTVVQ